MHGDLNVLTALLLDPTLTVAEAERQAGAAYQASLKDVAPATIWHRPPEWFVGTSVDRG